MDEKSGSPLVSLDGSYRATRRTRVHQFEKSFYKGFSQHIGSQAQMDQLTDVGETLRVALMRCGWRSCGAGGAHAVVDANPAARCSSQIRARRSRRTDLNSYYLENLRTRPKGRSEPKLRPKAFSMQIGKVVGRLQCRGNVKPSRRDWHPQLSVSCTLERQVEHNASQNARHRSGAGYVGLARRGIAYAYRRGVRPCILPGEPVHYAGIPICHDRKWGDRLVPTSWVPGVRPSRTSLIMRLRS